MSVATKALTAIGYAKAPKATLFLKHPVKATSAWIAFRAARKAAPKRRTLAKAAAAAVAVPLALKVFTTGSESNGRSKTKSGK